MIAIDLATMRRLFALLALLADAAIVLGVVLWVGGRTSPALRDLRDRIVAGFDDAQLWAAFTVALVSTLGSLYFSEIAHFEPCKLCWFQRIAMYPLVVLLGIAAWRRDDAVRRYAIPLAAIGAPISAYHYLIQNLPDLSSGSCNPAVPCTAAYVWEFGFVSIPYMALSGFLLIITILTVFSKTATNQEPTDATEVGSRR